MRTAACIQGSVSETAAAMMCVMFGGNSPRRRSFLPGFGLFSLRSGGGGGGSLRPDSRRLPLGDASLLLPKAAPS